MVNFQSRDLKEQRWECKLLKKAICIYHRLAAQHHLFLLIMDMVGNQESDTAIQRLPLF